MSRRTQENIVGGIVLAVFVVMLYLTFGYSSRARLVPLPVCIFGIVLAVAQLLWQNLRSADELRVNFLDVVGRGAIRDSGDGTAGWFGVSAGPKHGNRWKAQTRWRAVGLRAYRSPACAGVRGRTSSVRFPLHGWLSDADQALLARACGPLRFDLRGNSYGLFGFALGVQLNRGLLSGFISNFVDF